jgi:hypothetical protein
VFHGGECVINLPDVATIAAIAQLAQTGTSIDLQLAIAAGCEMRGLGTPPPCQPLRLLIAILFAYRCIFLQCDFIRATR